MKVIKLGIIGGGLMGKEAASACGRWFMLKDFPAKLELTAVSDLQISVLDWYKQINSVTLLTQNYHQLLASDVDVVYVAVPHHLHEQIYLDVLAAGKDLLAEKPFGLDYAAATRIEKAVNASGRFVRVSSEFPFLPGAQRVFSAIKEDRLGTMLEVSAGFHHSSDMDATKAINWKRQTQFCGQAGAMADLGLHVFHLPLRIGWKPTYVFAQLQKLVESRPDGKGGMAACDTWDNATLTSSFVHDGKQVPMRLEMKRMAPGATNSWYIEALGTLGGIRYSTHDPKALYTFTMGKEQAWSRTDLGHNLPYPVETGGIFEVGFPDCFMQMLAAYVAEREGFLNGRFGCATVAEVVESQRVFHAALESQKTSSVVQL